MCSIEVSAFHQLRAILELSALPENRGLPYRSLSPKNLSKLPDRSAEHGLRRSRQGDEEDDNLDAYEARMKRAVEASQKPKWQAPEDLVKAQEDMDRAT